MTSRPILFSAPMVRALLAGTKTQTRRVVKCNSPIAAVGSGADWNRWKAHPQMANPAIVLIDENGRPFSIPCRYGRPGGRLWVRETWAYHLHAQGSLADDDGPWVYAADGEGALQYRLCERWRPSIHMPRYVSRITLEVTDVRVERLQSISHADAMAEGMAWDDAVYDYSRLWESINGKDSWDLNPWVWVVSFARLGPGFSRMPLAEAARPDEPPMKGDKK